MTPIERQQKRVHQAVANLAICEPGFNVLLETRKPAQIFVSHDGVHIGWKAIRGMRQKRVNLLVAHELMHYIMLRSKKK